MVLKEQEQKAVELSRGCLLGQRHTHQRDTPVIAHLIHSLPGPAGSDIGYPREVMWPQTDPWGKPTPERVCWIIPFVWT